MSSTIFVPGRGAMDLSCRKVDLAVNEYDERLFAARSPVTGVDTVFIKMPRVTDWMTQDGVDIDGTRCMPVLGFPAGFPDPSEVTQRLYEIDATRHGTEILRFMNTANEKLKEPARREASERSGIVAEVSESAHHRLGVTPYHRSLAKKDPKQQVSTANKNKRKHGR